MRTVVSNADVLKMWSTQSQYSARNADNTYSFDSDQLKSYNTAIAYHTQNAAGARCVLIDCWNYSVTSAKHKPKPSDIPANVRVLYVDGLQGFWRCRTPDEIAVFIAHEIEHFLKIYEDLRNGRAADRRRAEVARGYAEDLREFFGLKMQTRELEAV